MKIRSNLTHAPEGTGGDSTQTPDDALKIRAVEDAVELRMTQRSAKMLDLCLRADLDLKQPVGEGASDDEKLLRRAMTDRTVTIEQATTAAFNLLATRTASAGIVAGGVTEITRDDLQTRFEVIGAALATRMGMRVEKDDEEKALTVRGLDGVGLCGECLTARGFSPRELQRMSREEIVHEAFHQPTGPRLGIRSAGGAHVTGDLTSIFANVINKEIRQPSLVSDIYRWYEKIGRQITFSTLDERTVVDFGGISNLREVAEGAEYKRVTIGDSKLSYALAKYGEILGLTEEMMLKNGGLDLFAGLLVEFLNASVRTRSQACVTAITSNPVMQDGVALFTAGVPVWNEKKKVNTGGHNNVGSSGGVPTVARLNEGGGMLFNQVDRAGNAVGAPAEFFIGNYATKVYVDQIFDPRRQVVTVADSCVINIPEANRLIVPELQNLNPWYLVTGDRSALEFGYLDGQSGPAVDKFPEHKNDTIDFKIKMRFATRATRAEKIMMNPGA